MPRGSIHPMQIMIAYVQYPETDRNAGALRVFEIIRILRSAGHEITFLSPTENDPGYRQALERIGVECVSDADRSVAGSVEKFGEFLRERSFEIAVFVQHFIYNRYAPYFRTLLPECRLIFDTLDLEYVRLDREANIVATAEARASAERVRREEISALRDADSVWVVTEVEKVTAIDVAAARNVEVIPTIHVAESESPSYESRHGLVFLGNYRHRPNADAMHYFVREVLPAIARALPDVHLSIAGSYPTDELKAYEQQSPSVRVTGFIEDHRALLKAHRVGIAPLRYGAGMKGKIGEYFACGLPCVTTSIGAEGMSLVHEHDALIADDPEQFAALVVRLYGDPGLWGILSRNSLDYIRRNVSVEAITPRVLAALASAAQTTVSRRTSKLANLAWVVRNPRELRRWTGTTIRVLRRGGLPELYNQVRIWLRRPPPPPQGKQ